MFNDSKTWKDVKESFSRSVREIFPVPDYAQFTAQLTSMVNFMPVIEPLIHILAPTHICEIGAYKSVNTAYLYTLAKRHNARLDCVDPCLDAQVQAERFPGVKCIPAKSRDYFDASPELATIYFLDGDHNYETLSYELDAIDSRVRGGNSPICLFLHDTGWPNSHFDMYYDKTAALNPEKLCDNRCLSLFNDAPTDRGMHAREVGLAVCAGGPENGTRAALEDFLRKSPHRWRHAFIPSIYGYSVVWLDDRLTDSQRGEFAKFVEFIDRASPFLFILELNRLYLYQLLCEAGDEWRGNVAAIRRLDSELKRVGKEWHDNMETIKRLDAELNRAGDEWRGNVETIKRLDAELNRAGDEWRDNVEVIKRLDSELNEAGKEWREHVGIIKRIYTELNQVGQEWSNGVETVRRLDAELNKAGEEWRENIAMIKKLDAELNRAGDIWRDNMAYIKELETRIAKTKPE